MNSLIIAQEKHKDDVWKSITDPEPIRQGKDKDDMCSKPVWIVMIPIQILRKKHCIIFNVWMNMMARKNSVKKDKRVGGLNYGFKKV